MKAGKGSNPIGGMAPSGIEALAAAIAGLFASGQFNALSILREYFNIQDAFIAQLLTHLRLVALALTPVMMLRPRGDRRHRGFAPTGQNDIILPPAHHLPRLPQRVLD